MGVTELLSGSLSGIVLYVAADSVCLWEEVSSEGGSGASCVAVLN